MRYRIEGPNRWRGLWWSGVSDSVGRTLVEGPHRSLSYRRAWRWAKKRRDRLEAESFGARVEMLYRRGSG